MLTFREFRDSEDDGDDERAMEVVRKGMNLQRGNDFWEDFLRLCGDSEGMAALLGVARDRVTGLSGRVERLKGMVGEPSKKTRKRDRMIKTGEEV
jgi:hypothetical protein